MTIRIYNTLNRKKEIFKPRKSGKVHIYVCGPTVYDSCHIGHARSVVVFDVIVRYFKAKGFAVTYVRNFTDVDDKIINRARERGIDPMQLSETYIKEFYEDMDALNVERATIEPRATNHIDEIISLVEKLLEKGFAYRINGDIYYSVESFQSYGKLSGRKLEDMEAGARVEIDERKKNPFDFSLWKSAKPGEPSWESPWGKGRPGWHIECSAMSMKYLGFQFDIHGGGKDLIFPHHENEIAQSEALSDNPFTNYWIHHGFVNIDHEKMSKSLHNILLIKDILKKYHPDAIRYFLLSHHYRSPIDYTDKVLEEASSNIHKFYKLLERVSNIPPVRMEDQPEAYWDRFCHAMDDDFNTAAGIAALQEAVRESNRLLDANASPEVSSQQLGHLLSQIYKMRDVLGILFELPDEYFRNIIERQAGEKKLDKQKIETMVRERSEARKSKDWSKADQIRKQLEEMNVILEDRKDGTVWRIED